MSEILDRVMRPPIGSVFAGVYRIERELSVGGMGAVYEVSQLNTERRRALKLMHPHLAAVPEFRERFAREARVGGRLASEHVVEVLDAGVDEETQTPWLAMELLEGADLATALKERGPLPAAEVAELFVQLGHALSAAHDAGVVHRDLKPENLFVARSHRVDGNPTLKVLDFGIAKVVREAATTSGATASLGTPLWMAPEQTEVGVEITPRADIWALGLIAFTLLTGRCYWLSVSDEEVSQLKLLREIAITPLRAASARAEELGCASLLPAGFDAWFARCVTRDVEDRFASVRQLVAELCQIIGERSPLAGPGGAATGLAEPGSAEPATTDQAGDKGAFAPTEPALLLAQPVRRSSPGAWVLAMLATAVLLGGGVIWLLLNDSQPSVVPSATATGTPGGGKLGGGEPATTAVPHRFEAGTGRIYFGLLDVGVVLFDGEQAKLIQPLKYDVHRMVELDGVVWVASIDGLYRIEGDASEEVYDSSVRMVAPISSQDVWAIDSNRKIGQRRDGFWTWSPRTVLGDDIQLLEDIAAGASGVWVMSTHALHHLEADGSWRAADLSKVLSDKPYFKRFGRAPDGTLYASHSTGVLRSSGSGWERVDLDVGVLGADELSVSPSGRLIAGSGIETIHVFSDLGTKKLTLKQLGVVGKWLRELSSDDAGRLWLCSDYALAVVDADGRLLRQYEPSTMQGVVGTISHAVVLGSPPLPVKQPLATGSVLGTMTLHEHGPLANQTVFLCPTPDMRNGCAGAPFSRSTRTNAAGAFRFDDIPIGSYDVAVKVGEYWKNDDGNGCCGRMKPGESYPMGEVELF